MRFRNFQVVVEKEPESTGYYAYVPGLPECICTAGRTAEEARRNIREAIMEHLAASRDSAAASAHPPDTHQSEPLPQRHTHSPAA